MDTIRFKRGSVWFVDDNYVGQGHIQSKSRPYVVVSNDKCNAYSPVIHMAPITSKVKGDYPQDVLYVESTGSQAVILCGQITPKDVGILVRCSRYMYTLSDELMKRVDEAIRVQFFYKEEDDSKEVVEEYKIEETIPTKEHKVVELDLPRTEGGRIKWTPELKVQFLEDAKEYIDEEMMVRYRLQKGSYLSTFYKFKKEFKNKEGV